MPESLIQIVPRFQPLFDGLGDHAHTLATALITVAGIPSRFVVTDPAWINAGGPQHDPRGTAVPAGNAAVLAETLARQGSTVLLHFVGYAYDGRTGQPQWLLDGLERWRRGDASRRLIIYFHELFASGPPWRKAFWLSAGQQRITAALAQLSDAAVTSNQQYADWLKRHLPIERPCQVWPVLSNLGEPDGVPAFDQRSRALVLFGHPQNRARAYHQDQAGLRALCSHLSIDEAHDIGAPLPNGMSPAITGVTLHQHGLMPAAEASHLLRSCQVGFIDNSAKPLGKSGVFAAYASHGLVPVVERVYPEVDGLVRDEHVIALSALPPANRFSQIAINAQTWYRQHRAEALARMIATTMNHLRPVAPTP